MESPMWRCHHFSFSPKPPWKPQGRGPPAPAPGCTAGALAHGPWWRPRTLLPPAVRKVGLPIRWRSWSTASAWSAALEEPPPPEIRSLGGRVRPRDAIPVAGLLSVVATLLGVLSVLCTALPVSLLAVAGHLTDSEPALLAAALLLPCMQDTNTSNGFRTNYRLLE